MAEPIVETTTGKLRGTETEGVRRFLGVPFAAPPVGALRFAAPQPAAPWAGVRDALAIGPRAPQRPSPMEAAINGGAEPAPTSEADCLNLNVWTPGLDGARRPVMVWIHGGAFVFGAGSSPWYDGQRFAQDHDVVLVSCNYRLGPLGFTFLGDVDPAFIGSGSVGNQDAVAVLRWVRDNIAAFGGDPGCVTIFGESAGAFSVASLLGMPMAQGLFHRAILQSGSASGIHDRATAAKMTDELRAALGNPNMSIAELQAVDTEDLLKAHARLMGEHLDEGLRTAPAVDGTVLPQRPIDAVAGGSVRAVPIMIGTNRDEWRLFALSNPKTMGITEAQLPAAVARFYPQDPERAIKEYRMRLGDDALSVVLSAVVSDAVFRVPSLRLADAQRAAGGDAYVYQFTWESPRAGGLLGSCHALELPFVFNNMDKPGVVEFAGETPPLGLAAAMNSTWAAFARTGDPSTGAMGEWPRYDAPRRTTMILDSTTRLEDDPLGNERALWM